jgi:hypothetical protein
MTTASTKIQRWVDLMAALLSHHGTQTFSCHRSSRA